MSVLRRIASALSPAPGAAAVIPRGVGRRQVVTGRPLGAGEGAGGAEATAGVPRRHLARARPGGDRDHLAALWVDLGGSD